MPPRFVPERRCRDAALNSHHRNALDTVTRFMGHRFFDYAEFLYGELVSGWTVPF